MKDAKGHGSDPRGAHSEGVQHDAHQSGVNQIGNGALDKLQKRQSYLIEKERLIRSGASSQSDKAHQFAVLKLEWEDLQSKIGKALRRQARVK